MTLGAGAMSGLSQRDAPPLSICSAPRHLPRDPLLKRFGLRLAGLQDQEVQPRLGDDGGVRVAPGITLSNPQGMFFGGVQPSGKTRWAVR